MLYLHYMKHEERPYYLTVSITKEADGYLAYLCPPHPVTVFDRFRIPDDAEAWAREKVAEAGHTDCNSWCQAAREVSV